MARTINQPSWATRPDTDIAQPQTDPRGPLDEQDQREEQNQSGDNDVRRQQSLTAVRDERDDSRENDSRENDSRQNGGDREVGGGRDDRKFGDKRGFGENRDRGEQDQLGERGEQDSRRGPWQSTAGADVYALVLDAYAPLLEAWKQVFQSWSELAETTVKAQQQSFAAMMGAAKPNIKDIMDGEHRGREHALSGAGPGPAGPDRVDHNRR
jgi:hypothetical protein